MSRFEFMHRTSGQIIERDYPVGRAPKRVRHDGRVYQRIPSLPMSMHVGDNINGKPIDFIANSLRPDQAALHRGRFCTNEHGERKPHIRSLAEIRELERRTAEAGIPVLHARSFK